MGSWTQGVGGWGSRWTKMPRRGEGPKVCRIFYLERCIFTSWLIEAFDSQPTFKAAFTRQTKVGKFVLANLSWHA